MPTAVHLFVALLILIGLGGSFLPLVPGAVLIWVAILLHKVWLGPESVSWVFVGWAAAAVVLSQVLDTLCTFWGARRFGASWRGALGAVVGGILGVLFFNIIGLVLGPIVGAVVAELVSDRSLREAGRAGLGTLVGGIAAFVLRLGISVGIVVAFYRAL